MLSTIATVATVLMAGATCYLAFQTSRSIKESHNQHKELIETLRNILYSQIIK